MQNWILGLAIFAWFFGIEQSLPYTEAAKVRMLVGPFQTVDECKDEMKSAIEGMRDRPGFRVVFECRESVGA